jgi:hypothetical protein
MILLILRCYFVRFAFFLHIGTTPEELSVLNPASRRQTPNTKRTTNPLTHALRG